MIFPLGTEFDESGAAFVLARGAPEHFDKCFTRDMMRTSRTRQNSPLGQGLHCQGVQFFIGFERGGQMFFGACVGRRINRDDIERPARALMREKGQSIAFYARGAVRDTVQLGIRLGKLESRVRAVHEYHFFSTGVRRGDAKSTRIGKSIQNPFSYAVRRKLLSVISLIKVKARLLTAREVHPKLSILRRNL